jgi:UDP-glucose 4-epimerase
VREVIAMVEKVAGKKLRTREVERRAGDPPSLIAAVDRIHRTLDWTPRFDDLETICASALAWERELAAGRWQDEVTVPGAAARPGKSPARTGT